MKQPSISKDLGIVVRILNVSRSTFTTLMSGIARDQPSSAVS